MSGRERFWAIGIRVRVEGGTVCTIDRVAVPRGGWWQVTYDGKRYQLFGGDRCDYFINLHRPCKRREKLPK